MNEICFYRDGDIIDKRFINIGKMEWKDIKANKIFSDLINFYNINVSEMKKQIRLLLKLKKKAIAKKYTIGINGIIFYIVNYDKDNKKQKEYIWALEAILKNDDREMYTYIYDKVCESLDDEFYGKNLCDFKNNKCGEKINTKSEIGCCRHYKNKFFGPYLLNNKFVQCEYLIDCRCNIKCLPCKLYTCDYLERKGIKFKIKNFFLLDTFFNLLQKYTLKTKVYTPEEKIINTLLEERFKFD